MSIVSNRHTSVVYESKGKNKTVAFTGQRLVVTIAKADKAGNYGEHLQQTMATSIPVLSSADIDWMNQDVQSACVQYLQSVQNDIIADRIKSTGERSHSDDELNQDAILAYLERESAGDKWDVERVAQWFSDTLGDALGMMLLEKHPEWENAELEESLEKNVVAFSKALGSKGKIHKEHAVIFQKRLQLIESAKWDRVAKRFNERLEGIINPVLEAELDLGD